MLLLLIVFSSTVSAASWLFPFGGDGTQIESQLSYRRFTTLDGLPQMQTETVWQDSRGYIYIGTLSGFVRYDGLTLTPFLRGQRENIVGFQEVGDYKSPTTNAGDYKSPTTNAGDYKSPTTKAGDYKSPATGSPATWKTGQVRAMGFVRQWLIDGDEATMMPIDPEGQLLLNNFNAADLPPGYVLLEDRQEQHRVLCFVGDYKFPTTEDYKFPTTEGVANGMTRVVASPLFDEMTPDRKLYMDSTGIYVPTPKGLYVMDPHPSANTTHHSPFTLHHSPFTTHPEIFSLIRTADGLYALGADGIYRVGRDSLRLLCAHHFEAPDYGLAVRQNHQGQLIIADSHTIWLYDGKAPQPMHQLATGFNMIKGLFVDRWNRLWVATYQGVYCFFHCNFVNHRLTDQNDIVRAIAFLPPHSSAQTGERLVMGTLNGSVLVDGRPVSRDADNFYAPSAVTLGDRVYLAGRGDVAAVEGETLQWLGLPDDKYQLVSRWADRLIIGTRGSVLSYDPVSRRLDTLTTDIVRPWCAVDDGQGQLWVSGNPGLYCMEKPANHGAAPTMRQLKRTPTTLVITAMATDGRGNVCFAQGDSLFAIHYARMRFMDEVMATLKGHEIRTLHMSARGYLAVAAIDGLLVARLDAECRATDVHWFDAHNGFTMIEPLKSPMAESADGTLWLAGLEEMTSFNPEDLLSDNQQSTVVEAPRPWWQQVWVWVVAVALLSLVVWLLARWSGQRHTRRKLARLEREKTQKELQLSAVRLKAFPHFHANVLAGIEYFVMNNSVDEATHYLKLYSDFTNRTLSDIDRPARTVDEEVDYVCNYLELEQLRYGERVQYDISVADDVDCQTLLPTMLLYTYCQNAVKHGISVKPHGGHIGVVINRQQENGTDYVVVSVSDDGVGRAVAAQQRSHSSRQGLRILLEQIALYNETNRHHISQRVKDLHDAQGRPAGTCYEMWIPTDYEFKE